MPNYNGIDFKSIVSNNDFPYYNSPFFESNWQTYYMEDLINYIKNKEANSYNYYVTSFTETTDNKLIPPEQNRLNGIFSNPELPKSFSTQALIDMRVRPTERFYIYIVTSKHGNGLRDYFNKGVCKENDLAFFLEDNTGDMSEPVLLCKMGINWRKRFNSRQTFTYNSKQMLDQMGIDLSIDAAKFYELITKGEIKGYPWLGNADIAGKVLFGGVYFLNYLASSVAVGILNVVIGGLEKLKIPDSGWMPSSENPGDFNPALISKNAQQGITLTTETIAAIIDEARKKLEELDKLIDSFLKSDLISDAFVKRIVGGFLTKAKAFINQVKSDLEILKAILLKLAEVTSNVLNAFLCGIVNGFLDAVIGLATVIKWLFDIGIKSFNVLKDINNKLPHLLETLDDLILAWNEFSFAALFSSLSNAFVKFLNDVFSELGGGIDEKTLYRIAYFAGNVTGFVIEFVIELVITGGVAAVGKFFTGLAGFGKNIAEMLTKLVKGILNISVEGIGKDLASMLRIITSFFKLKGEQLAAFFTRFFEELKAIFGIGLKPETEAIFEKLGLTWGSKRIPTLNVGISPLGDKLWGVYHKGVVVKQGTKKEMDEFAKKLKGMGDNAAEKSLNNLLNKVFIISNRFEEHIISGHIRIKKFKADKVIEEYEYLANKGGRSTERGFNYSPQPSGFHMLSKLDNKLVRITENIGTKKLPTGETVRLTKIDYWVEELGQWVSKKNTHTFFPSKWDFDKIKEVIQEATQNSKSILGNKYHGITKDGVKIEFYINETTREINTGYIIFE